MSLLFALWPDETTRDALAQQRMHFAKMASGKPTSPPTLHVTLSFSSDDDEAKLIKIGKRIRLAPFDFKLDMVDCSERAKIAWMGADQTPQAMFDLHQQIRAAMIDAGCETDPRAFRPHITVARDIATPFEPVEMSPVIWRIDKLSLVKTRRTSLGANYEVIASWSLEA